MAKRRSGAKIDESPPSCIGVVITPCIETTLLHHALALAAERCGYAWRVDQDLTNPEIGPLERRLLVICSDASLFSDIPLTNCVVIVGEIGVANHAAMAYYGFSPRDGIVYASRCFAFASELIEKSEAIHRFSTNQIMQDPGKGFADLLEALDLPLDSAARLDLSDMFASQAAERLLTRPDWQVEPTLQSSWDSDLRPSAAMWWPRERFWSVAPDWNCPDVIDITGRNRCLTFGPYFSLPAGCWRLTMSFSLCRDAARRHYHLDVVADYISVIAVSDIWPDSEGKYAIPLEIELTACARIEARIFIMSAALHGEFTLLGCNVERLDVPDRTSQSPISEPVTPFTRLFGSQPAKRFG